MKNIIMIAALTFLFTFVSYGQAEKEKTKEATTQRSYTRKEIGWTIKIPDGWKLRSQKKSEELLKVGKDAVEDATNIEIDSSGLQNLIGFEKDIFNLFISTMEPFKAGEKAWLTNNNFVKSTIATTYKNKGIKSKISETTIEKVSGLDFRVFTVEIMGRDNKIIITQTLYCSFINGYDFAAVLNYNSAENKKDLFEAFRESVFKAKK